MPLYWLSYRHNNQISVSTLAELSPGTQIASSGSFSFPKARRLCLGRLATQAAMNASSLSCLLPATECFNVNSRSFGIQSVAAETACRRSAASPVWKSLWRSGRDRLAAKKEEDARRARCAYATEGCRPLFLVDLSPAAWFRGLGLSI